MSGYGDGGVSGTDELGGKEGIADNEKWESKRSAEEGVLWFERVYWQRGGEG